MRNIEKGVLLAELFEVDTSRYVPSFIQWIKNTPEYSYFVEKSNSLKIKRTWKARRFHSYFETIDIDSIETIKEGMIEYGKLCYLVKITSEPAYTNPLIVEDLDMINMKLGDIVINFDNKLITLKELAKLEGFSFERKEEVVKERIENWVKEVEDSIFMPIEEYKRHMFYLPEIKMFSFSRIFQLVYLLLVNALLICIYLIKIPLFENIISDHSSLKFFLYSLSIGFTFVYDIIYVIIMIYRKKKYGYYSKARNGVINDIYKEKDKCETKLRLYIYEQLATKGDMNAKVFEFSKISKYYPYIGYIRKHLSLKRRIKVDKTTAAEKTGFIVTLIFVIALLVVMFI